MNRVVVAAALLIAASAQADDDDRPSVADPASKDRVVAITLNGEDVEDAILVGPSGQVYEPDGKGAWTRKHGGGVAADVTGATMVDGDLVVTGRAAPMYRRDGATWFALPIGESGRTALSRGPAVAVAIGKKVFVLDKGKWVRVGSLPGKATAVWAAGKKSVWASTDAQLYKLAGSEFKKVGDPVVGLGGAEPWAITADGGLRDLGGGKTVPGELDGAHVTALAVAGADDDLRVVVQTAGGALVLARVTKGALARVDDVPGAGPVAGLAVAGGKVLVALGDGTVATYGKAWTTVTVADALPADADGPAPARTR